MRLLDNLTRRSVGSPSAENSAVLPDINHLFMGGMSGSKPDHIDSTFTSMVEKVHEKSGVVSAAVFARSLLISQIRFVHGDEGASTLVNVAKHASTSDLARLERPGSMTRQQMLKRMEQDVSYAGNAFLVPGKRRKLHRLPPHRITFVLGSDMDPTYTGFDEGIVPYDAELAGIIYNPNDDGSLGDNLQVFRKGEFVHWMPEPDPIAFWRGGSWIQSALSDVALEGQIDDHQAKFFEHAATPKMVFVADGTMSGDELQAAAIEIRDNAAGTQNAYKSMFIGGIKDVRTVGQDFDKIGFSDLRGAIEIATAMRSRIPAAILGTSDSLEGSSLNAGNYGAARRMWADGWFTPTVEDLCSALEPLAPPPRGKMLTADQSHVLFLQEDKLDQSTITQTQMAAIRNAVDGGFSPESATVAVTTGDLTLLDHTGLLSVQLQQPGANEPDDKPDEPEVDNARSDLRTVVSRLGRFDGVSDIDENRLLAGLTPESQSIIHGVLDDGPFDSMDELRAAVIAAMNGEQS